MLKRLVLVTAVCLLAACGKSADDYVGYWREQRDRGEEILEIKKENGNYFAQELINQTNFFGSRKNAVVLTEKDGKLSINSGMGEMVLNLSDDGKTLYVGDQSYVKVDAGFKDKIEAHEQDCRKLSEEYKTEHNKLSYGDREYAAKSEEINQRFKAEFVKLENEIRCNSKPLGVIR